MTHSRFDGLCIIDADTHLTEPHDLWTSRAPKGYEDRVPQVREKNGVLNWTIEDHVLARALASGVVAASGEKVPGTAFFGWSISVAMLLQTVLLWQLSSLARTDPARVRPMIGTLALATLVSGMIAWRFIFPLPALFSLALLVPLVVAYVVATIPGGASITSAATQRTATR